VRPDAILETVLYANDLESSAYFYTEVIGLPLIGEIGETGFACRVAPGSVLLVFDPRQSDKPGRSVPIHGARGPGHLALRVRAPDLGAWRSRLSAHGVAVELEKQWGQGDGFAPGSSVYIRDPSGNSVELVTGDIWKGFDATQD